MTVYEDFEPVAALINAMKTFKRSVSIDNISTTITVSLKVSKNNEQYIIINCIKYIRTILGFSENGFSMNDYMNSNCFKSLMFFPELKIYFQHREKWIPANLKTFGNTAPIVRDMFFEYMAKNNLIWKDFMPYSRFPSIPFELMADSHTLKDLFDKKFKTDLPKTVNKKPPAAVYAACCAMKYVDENQRGILFSSAFEDKNVYGTQKEIAKRFILGVICERLKIAESDNNIIRDYVNMALIGKEKVNLKLGKKGYKRLHDEFAKKFRVKGGKKLKIPDTPLAQLELPEDFFRITTKQELEYEAAHNSNCVWSYASDIESGKCLIYILDYNDEHCTIEIGYFRKKYVVRQLRTHHNRDVSAETQEYVQNAVKAANKK